MRIRMGDLEISVTRRARPRPRTGYEPAPAGRERRGTPGGEDTHAAPRCDEDRDTLIEACVWAHEAITVRAIRQRLEQELEAVGVRIVGAPGGLPDLATHVVLGTVPVTGDGHPGRIAKTIRTGIIDRDRVLRVAEVYTYDGEDWPHE